MSPEAAGSHAEELSIEPFDGTVTVRFSDAVIASTRRARILQEPGREPVLYIPFEDIYFDFLKRANHSTRCPIKGTASYWDVSAVGDGARNVMWAYETPNPVASAIADHGAFDERLVSIDADPIPDTAHRPHLAE
ncbi:DUF427 domain-containing protein [Pseudaminobacter sp. 19-2017]|uniref:DUF427 domain-containing protein n=1 Tax=Pseudaminobacter soli (ex Zhang et al. 2022) TaxID=2831468 RepID=A0A942I8E8_9HYPH|nr:DUF427 domain-containing protein [Pseudaminobacter soli]MBS3649295.1 DUF427 domain-containing protein [Pseudaminobacter soli]